MDHGTDIRGFFFLFGFLDDYDLTLIHQSGNYRRYGCFPDFPHFMTSFLRQRHHIGGGRNCSHGVHGLLRQYCGIGYSHERCSGFIESPDHFIMSRKGQKLRIKVFRLRGKHQRHGSGKGNDLMGTEPGTVCDVQTGSAYIFLKIPHHIQMTYELKRAGFGIFYADLHISSPLSESKQQLAAWVPDISSWPDRDLPGRSTPHRSRSIFHGSSELRFPALPSPIP